MEEDGLRKNFGKYECHLLGRKVQLSYLDCKFRLLGENKWMLDVLFESDLTLDNHCTGKWLENA